MLLYAYNWEVSSEKFCWRVILKVQVGKFCPQWPRMIKLAKGESFKGDTEHFLRERAHPAFRPRQGRSVTACFPNSHCKRISLCFQRIFLYEILYLIISSRCLCSLSFLWINFLDQHTVSPLRHNLIVKCYTTYLYQTI